MEPTPGTLTDDEIETVWTPTGAAVTDDADDTADEADPADEADDTADDSDPADDADDGA
ncbi:MAG TPA: hypothetical protein VF533_14300 [Solirubrobacteraceae bacterium]|jgi:hypothetical protein